MVTVALEKTGALLCPMLPFLQADQKSLLDRLKPADRLFVMSSLLLILAGTILLLLGMRLWSRFIRRFIRRPPRQVGAHDDGPISVWWHPPNRKSPPAEGGTDHEQK